MRHLPLSLFPLFLLGACTVGPDYERPASIGAAGDWATSGVSGDAVDLEPWRGLGDALLVELIERAASANLDLRQAEARLREARAGLDAAAGRRLPQAGITGSATRQRLSENGPLPVGSIPGFEPEFSMFDAGFDASWEIDLWGGTRRAVEAAGQRVIAAEAQQREARLRIVAEVERAYAELRGAQAEAALLRADAQASSSLSALLRQSYRAGEISRSEDADAQARALRAEAALPAAEARIRAASHALALLTAQPPEALLDRLLVPVPIPEAPVRVAAGLRSDILRRRPDVAAAEAQLAAATSDIGVETANLFPRLSLIGGIGQQARNGAELTSGSSTRFQIGPSLSWPIFSGGRILAQIRAASARADGAAAAYEQAVLGALSDSETAINRYNAAVSAARELTAARESSAVSLGLARQRHRAGEDSVIQLRQAELQFNAADRAASEARMQALQAHAGLVKALGGGWVGSDVATNSARHEP